MKITAVAPVFPSKRAENEKREKRMEWAKKQPKAEKPRLTEPKKGERLDVYG